MARQFEEDFYGSQLKALICGFVRPERNFDSVEDLIAEIHQDIKKAKEALDLEQYEHYRNDSFFAEPTVVQ